MEYVAVQSCPVPKELAAEVELLLRESGSGLNSCYRGADAEALLHKLGKKSQRELYDGFVRGLPGYNPANPPGFSTHECRNDGIAYGVPRGAKLEYWQVGLDLTDPAAFCTRARAHGWIATVTYSSGLEAHHVNFRKEPEFKVFDALKKGDSGDRVKKLIDLLAFIHRPRKYGDNAYLPDGKGDLFNEPVFKAVKTFQKDHHLKDDGVVGKHTWQQIIVSDRQEKQNRQINSLKTDLREVEKNLEDQRAKKPRTKETEQRIKELGKKADQLRDEIRKLGGNPSTA